MPKSKMHANASALIYKRAIDLRKQQTFTEELLWNYLKLKPFGYKFSRQHPYAVYILDFYCHRMKFVIEVDGSIHNKEEVKANDIVRQRFLEDAGLFVLRLTNDQIINNIEVAKKIIEDYLQDRK